MRIRRGAYGPGGVLYLRVRSTTLDLTTVDAILVEWRRRSGATGTWVFDDAPVTTAHPAATATTRWYRHVWAADRSELPSVEIIDAEITLAVGSDSYSGGAFTVETYK